MLSGDSDLMLLPGGVGGDGAQKTGLFALIADRNPTTVWRAELTLTDKFESPFAAYAIDNHKVNMIFHGPHGRQMLGEYPRIVGPIRWQDGQIGSFEHQ